jgi:uncharacterized membrane protein YdjX (TVP38/TMEM64 family)
MQQADDMRTNAGDPGLGPPKWLRPFLAFLLIAAAGLAVTHFTSIRELLNMDQMSRTAAAWGIWAPVFLFGLASAAPLLFLPRWPIAMICGILYGVVGGTVLANICCTSGAWVQYTLAKRTLSTMGRRLRIRQAWAERISQNPDRAFASLFLLRAFPFSNSVATNVVAGTLEIRNGVYLAATFLGMLPSTLMYAAWGKLLKRPEPHFYAFAVGLLVVLVVATALAHRRLQQWFPVEPDPCVEGGSVPDKIDVKPLAADPSPSDTGTSRGQDR